VVGEWIMDLCQIFTNEKYRLQINVNNSQLKSFKNSNKLTFSSIKAISIVFDSDLDFKMMHIPNP
jgi:hypothetical protein